MPKRSRNIPFHEKMAVPCTSIPSQRHKKQKPPIKQQRAEEEEDRNKGPHKMPTPCRWLRVLVHVEGPELLQAPEIHIFK